MRYLHIVLLGLVLIAVVCWPVSHGWAGTTFDDVEPDRLELISEYFEILAAVEESEAQFVRLTEEIDELTGQLTQLQSQLQESQQQYMHARERTVTALRWLNRKGPMSYLQVLLGAASVRDLLRRAQLVSQTARGVLAAFSDVKAEGEMREQLKEEIEEVSGKIAGLQAERDSLAAIREDLHQHDDQLAEVFGHQWAHMAARLDELIVIWQDSCIRYLEQLPERFARLAKKDLDPDDITVATSLFEVVVTVPEASLNEILDTDPQLRGAEFRFTPQQAQLRVDELSLAVYGELSITRQGLVTFQPVGVQLDGIPLSPDVAGDAIHQFGLDLSSAVGALRAESLTVRSGEVEILLSLLR